MKKEAMLKDIQDSVFEKLKDIDNYWGENSILAMMDFCKRNNLELERKILMNVWKTDRLKETDTL